MDLSTLQQTMELTYGERDRDRGVPSAVAWLAEEVGELARGGPQGEPCRSTRGVRRCFGVDGVAGKPDRRRSHRGDG